MLTSTEEVTLQGAPRLALEESKQNGRSCFFTELDPFLSTLPQDLSSVDALCTELKLACIYFDVVDINRDVFSHNPIALTVFSKLRPLVKAGLLWPSARKKERPQDFITRKVSRYAAQSMSSDRELDVMLNQWLSVIPNEFRAFKQPEVSQPESAIRNTEKRFMAYQHEPFYPRLWNHLQEQKARQQFDREDTIANIAFISRSFSKDMRSLAESVSAEHLYQCTRNQQHQHAVFPGFTGMKLMRIHPHIARRDFDRQHIFYFHHALKRCNLSLNYLLSLPIETLCTVLMDDAFVHLRRYHQWPDEPKHQAKRLVLKQEQMPETTVKLKRTIKANYALPLLYAPKTLSDGGDQAYLSLHAQLPMLVVTGEQAPLMLTLDEHSLLKLIAYNPDQQCFIEEALQQLLVSRDMDANRPFREYSEADVLERRNYFDAMVVYPFNQRMLAHGIQIHCQEGVLSCHHLYGGSTLSIIDGFDNKMVIDAIQQLSKTLSKSKIRRVIERIDHFTTPIHSSFVMKLCELPDAYHVSRLIHRVNKKLASIGAKIAQPSRGYYLLTSTHNGQKVKN